MNNCELLNPDAGEKELLESGLLLPVMEMFYSVQGEGYNTGKAAFFIRIGGCDVGCHWCDAKESWNASVHPLTSVETIVQQVMAYPAQSVVITGGEPLMYNLDPLCSLLKEHDIRIFLETSGTCPLSGSFDWICLSPKPQVLPRKDMLQLADELKVIIENPEDLSFAPQNLPHLKKKCLLYLQPEWSRYKEILPVIVEYVKDNPQWMISLQAHKFMNIP